MKKLIIQGHQGTRDGFPGNTLPSFIKALDAPVDVLELDLQLTKDKKIVIFHDFFIQGKDQILVKDLTYDELQNFFPEETKPPLFEDLLKTLQNSKHLQAKKVHLNLDIKRDPLKPDLSLPIEDFVKRIPETLKSYGFLQRTYCSSFDPATLTLLKNTHPDLEVAFIYNHESLSVMEKLKNAPAEETLIELCHSFKAKIVSPDHALLKDETIVCTLQKEGFQVIPWTVNTEADWEKCIKLGVDGLITDVPEKLQVFLEKNE